MLEDQILGKNDSWAIRWNASAFLNNKLTLYPGRSLVINIGNDGSGEHKGNTSIFDATLSRTNIELKNIDIIESKKAYKAFCRYFSSQSNIFSILRNRLKRYFINQNN